MKRDPAVFRDYAEHQYEPSKLDLARRYLKERFGDRMEKFVWSPGPTVLRHGTPTHRR